MLTPEFYETATNPLSELINSTENPILHDIARRIAKTGRLTATAEYQLARLADIREIDKNYKTELAELLKLSEQEIDRLYQEAATQAHVYDRRLFEAKGIPFIPYEENAYLQQITAAVAGQTKQEFKNLSQSMGVIGKNGKPLPPKQFYTETLDNAVFQITTGVKDYNSAIRNAVKTMMQGQFIDGQRVGEGLMVVTYESGAVSRIDVAARRAVLTGMKQIESRITFRNIDALGARLVEVSAHEGARPEHQIWQGRIFSLNNFNLDI